MLRELEDEGWARSALEQAFGVAETIEDQQGVAESLRQLGFLYYLQGGWDRALELYHRALALQKRGKGSASTSGSPIPTCDGIWRPSAGFERNWTGSEISGCPIIEVRSFASARPPDRGLHSREPSARIPRARVRRRPRPRARASQPVEVGRGERVVAEDPAPLRDQLVGGDERAALLGLRDVVAVAGSRTSIYPPRAGTCSRSRRASSPREGARCPSRHACATWRQAPRGVQA